MALILKINKKNVIPTLSYVVRRVFGLYFQIIIFSF